MYFRTVSIYYCAFCFIVFFFKQKTAYEMRISDWSSDVCSSDLVEHRPGAVRSVGSAHMHLVAAHRHAGRAFDTGRHAQRLRRSERGLDVEQAESFRFARRPHDADRIGDPSAEHLVAAAEPDDRSEEHTSNLKTQMSISYDLY